MSRYSVEIGTQVIISVNRENVVGTYRGHDDRYDVDLVEYQGRMLRRNIRGIASTGAASTTMPVLPVGSPDEEVVEVETTCTAQVRSWDINVRFSFIERMVDMVACGPMHSMIVTGTGGLGKSTTVMARLNERHLKPGEDYVVIKGFCTPLSLFRQMWQNRDRLIVFDDCDSVLDNIQALNLLKSALDDKPVREVSWLTSRNEGTDSEGDSIPRTFQFTGKIIFISNKKLRDIDQTIITRSLFVDVTMTSVEKIARMRALKLVICPDIALDVKEEVLTFLDTMKDQTHDLSLRSFRQVLLLRSSEPTLWRDLAEYMLTSSPVNN